MSIAENLIEVRERIREAERRSGRTEGSVKLLAVAKYVDEARILEAITAGQTAFGENHAQELRQKLNFYKLHGCETHFIGQAQTNKIKYICGIADCIQSVDRSSFAEALERYAAAHEVVQPILIQVNIGNEPQKGGAALPDLDALLDTLCTLRHLKPCGLMCVPPDLDGEAVRPLFAKLRELKESAAKRYPELPLTELSMGMSHDYQVAVEEGATIVRVGTAIFGARVTR